MLFQKLCYTLIFLLISAFLSFFFFLAERLTAYVSGANHIFIFFTLTAVMGLSPGI